MCNVVVKISSNTYRRVAVSAGIAATNVKNRDKYISIRKIGSRGQLILHD